MLTPLKIFFRLKIFFNKSQIINYTPTIIKDFKKIDTRKLFNIQNALAKFTHLLNKHNLLLVKSII